MTSTAEVKTICNLLIDYLPVIKELITTLIIIAGIAMVCLLVITFISIKILNDLEDISSESTALKKLLFKIYFAHRITMKSKHGIDLDKAAEEYQRKRFEILRQQLDDYCETLLGHSPSNTDTENLKEE